ncbi:hypothetical protein J7T55_000920 [Diaporthe amygdali]|uniref:uncharacterized protein n=1 Tax=Phomopsis amygdali TaxID=1214568 RepID=UPI0022FDFCE4|nr:uncharacterized protein J7T55_000920 [Diaporthe amygdali]KAJ0120067.1 hypothetical protein J7T55_000920 [Diaporthe amygdali]
MAFLGVMVFLDVTAFPDFPDVKAYPGLRVDQVFVVLQEKSVHKAYPGQQENAGQQESAVHEGGTGGQVDLVPKARLDMTEHRAHVGPKGGGVNEVREEQGVREGQGVKEDRRAVAEHRAGEECRGREDHGAIWDHGAREDQRVREDHRERDHRAGRAAPVIHGARGGT